MARDPVSTPTALFEREIRDGTDASRPDIFEAKGRALARAQAFAVGEVFRSGFLTRSVKPYLERLDAAQADRARAVAEGRSTDAHVAELVAALYANIAQVHVTRRLTWWAVVASVAGTLAAFLAVVLTIFQLTGCAR